MLPDQQGDHPHILVQAGKEGRIVVLDRDNLGGYAPGGTSNTNALQDIPGQIGGCWSTPAYWNWQCLHLGRRRMRPKVVRTRQWRVRPTEPIQPVDHHFGISRPILFHLVQWHQDGIAWAVRSDQFNTHGALVLYAWDANDLTNTHL